VNQLKVGPTIVQKAKSDVGNNEEESQERSQSDVTASVSADHDYNGQNSRINGDIPKLNFFICKLYFIIS
jgi:hypothetical protein